ncbi:hypothetical protein EVAR_13758_1 [Eumeta japonica]|uniref:Uncharacterized protein n=1 Tax=Eumeta variegata TaxID=151549 RepID=A0A4C1UCE9_EUMVA|nr:hypothetical protein EVAR_13758_1 [Eumeta japonica]
MNLEGRYVSSTVYARKYASIATNDGGRPPAEAAQMHRRVIVICNKYIQERFKFNFGIANRTEISIKSRMRPRSGAWLITLVIDTEDERIRVYRFPRVELRANHVQFEQNRSLEWD